MATEARTVEVRPEDYSYVLSVPGAYRACVAR